jgi:hypothetical protein
MFTRAAPSKRQAPALALRPLSAYPADGEPVDTGAAVAAWMRAYLMRPHPDLGRPGAVCPYTPLAAKADLALIGVSEATDEDEIHAVMREAVQAFDAMPCSLAQKTFRCVLVAFPAGEGEERRRRLKAVQNRLRPESTRRGKMIGLFEPNSEDKGLLNPEFRPLRAPLPILAIRSLVENDAPFVLRNPRLAPIYLWRYPASGALKLARRLWA